MKINWINLIFVSIPGVVPFMILHNLILYQEPPLETIIDIWGAVVPKDY